MGSVPPPLKPWEANSGLPIASGLKPYISNTDRLHSSAIPYPGSGGGGFLTQTPTTTTAAPRVPPRPQGAMQRPLYSASRPYMPYSSSYSPYGGGYGGGGYMSPFSMGNMGMGSTFSPYGASPYGGSYGAYNRQPYGMEEPSFTQMAEESAASAFQSIESFVSAFGSIAAMLDSTFHALYSSFRAVVGVADHLGRVKQIMSAFAIFRFFKWTYRRLLYLIGISKIKPADIESLWNNINTEEVGGALLKGGEPKSSNWPIVMFLGFIFAGPYLMWKLIRSLNLDPQQKVDRMKWASGEDEHFVASAEYDFEAAGEGELSMKAGQTLRLATMKNQPPNVNNWVLASDGVRIGLVPISHIKVIGKRRKDESGSTVMTPISGINNSLKPTPSTSQGLENPISSPAISQHSLMQESLANDAAGGMSSDDDCETLVGDPITDDT